LVSYKVFIFPSNTPIITIKSTVKATRFGPSFTSSTFWDPKLFTKAVRCYNAVLCCLHWG